MAEGPKYWTQSDWALVQNQIDQDFIRFNQAPGAVCPL